MGQNPGGTDFHDVPLTLKVSVNLLATSPTSRPHQAIFTSPSAATRWCRTPKKYQQQRKKKNATSRSHFAHRQLWCLASGPDRERYEELRAAYNPVRPAGLSPAPPFEEWRGMSDICDHAYCRCVCAPP